MNSATQETLKEARAQWIAGDHAAGGKLFVEAMDAEPLDPAIDIALADTALLSSDFKVAENAYGSAIEKSPDTIDLYSRHAAVLISLGEFDKARTQLEKAIHLNPLNGLAYFVLTRIHTATTSDPFIDTLEKIRTSKDTPRADAGYAEFALAKFYDDIGDWDRAFECISSANSRVPIQYDHNSTADHFKKIKTVFSADFIAKFNSTREQDLTPIFALGMPRNGATLVEEYLSRFQGVVGLGEIGDMGTTINQILPLSSGQRFPANAADLPSESFSALGDYYLHLAELHLRDQLSTTTHFIDKHPMNFMRIGLIKIIAPQARIIHVKRDPRDICLSIFQQASDPSLYPFSYNMINIANFYGLYHDIMEHWERAAPETIKTIHYKDVINNTNDTINSIAAHAGIQSINTGQNTGAIQSAAAWQVRQPIHAKSIDRWKNYEKHLAPLQETLHRAGVQF